MSQLRVPALAVLLLAALAGCDRRDVLLCCPTSTALSVHPREVALRIGGVETLGASASIARAGNVIEWVARRPSVVVLESAAGATARVRAVSAGTAYVVVRLRDEAIAPDSVRVTVTP